MFELLAHLKMFYLRTLCEATLKRFNRKKRNKEKDINFIFTSIQSAYDMILELNDKTYDLATFLLINNK